MPETHLKRESNPPTKPIKMSGSVSHHDRMAGFDHEFKGADFIEFSDDELLATDEHDDTSMLVPVATLAPTPEETYTEEMPHSAPLAPERPGMSHDEQNGLRITTNISADFDAAAIAQVEEIGLKIRNGRKRRGLNQSEYAAAIGISRKTLSNIEGGDPGTQIENVAKAASGLGISLVTA